MPKSILVVDDNDLLIKAWDRLLTGAALDHQVTTDPYEALDWLGQRHFDIVISDIVMPRLDGFDFIRAAWQRDPQLQLVFTTAYDCDFTKAPLEASTEHASDIHVLMKPYRNLDKIEDFIGRLIAADPSLNKTDALENQHQLRFHLWNL